MVRPQREEPLRLRSERLKKCREESHLTIEEIAKKLHVSIPTLYRYESEEHALSDTEQLMVLAKLYDKSVSWLAYGLGSESRLKNTQQEELILTLYRKASPQLQDVIYSLASIISEEEK